MNAITEAEYRAIPALSGTGVADLLRSPALYRWKIDNPSESTPSQTVGTLAHALILGQEHPFILSEFPDFRTKAAQEWKAEQIAAGREVVTADTWDTAHRIAEAVRAHPAAAELLAMPGEAERVVEWTEGDTPCKGRLDWLAGAVVDIKTTRSIETFDKHIGEYGYHAQVMHYRRGAIANGLPAEPRPLFIVAENEAPYRVRVMQLSEIDAAQGEAMCLEAYRRWADCMAAGVWPSGLPEGVTQTNIPAWSARVWDARIEGAVA